jgi:hypothetical protein
MVDQVEPSAIKVRHSALRTPTVDHLVEVLDLKRHTETLRALGISDVRPLRVSTTQDYQLMEVVGKIRDLLSHPAPKQTMETVNQTLEAHQLREAFLNLPHHPTALQARTTITSAHSLHYQPMEVLQRDSQAQHNRPNRLTEVHRMPDYLEALANLQVHLMEVHHHLLTR